MIVPHRAIVLVVDCARMQTYRNEGSLNRLHLVQIYHHEHASGATSALGSERAGRSFQSSGVLRSAYEGPDYHQKNEDEFPLFAAETLERIATAGERLILVAAPHALAVMRKHIGKAVKAALLAKIAKDMTGRPAGEIGTMLEHYMPHKQGD